MASKVENINGSDWSVMADGEGYWLINCDTLENFWISAEGLQEMRDVDSAPVVEISEQQESEPATSEPAQVATKVEKLAENLKHLDKTAYLASPHRWTALAETTKPGISRTTKFWTRKVQNGRNKPGLPLSTSKELTQAWYLDDLGTSRLSRSALLRWFPVALENTTYSDAIIRHRGTYYQQGLRATRGFLQDACLYRKYQWWGLQSSAVYGNKVL